MATDKKGFILYADQKDLFDQLPNDKAGELIKHIFSYVNDENPESKDIIINLAFTPIKQQFKRDLDKWEGIKESRSRAGKASAEARRLKAEQKSTNPTSVESVEQKSTNPTVNDNVNVTVNVKDNVKVKDIYRAFAHLSISIEDKDKLLEKYSIDQIDSILNDIQNYKKNKNYTSLYLTACKWLKKEKTVEEQSTHSFATNR